VNFFRAVQRDPAQLAHQCNYPVTELDMNAWHFWLMEPTKRHAFVQHLLADPDFFDLLRAARWLHGINAFIGAGWCRGDGAWEVIEGQVGKARRNCLHGINLQNVHASALGQGIHRRTHIPQVGNLGRGIHKYSLRETAQQDRVAQTLDWFTALQDRLRDTRVSCGDWQRVCTPACTTGLGVTGIVFDPPYSLEEDRDMELYAHDDGFVAHSVREWCVDRGDDPKIRAVFCGYGDVHDELLSVGWTKYHWLGHAGYGNTGDHTRGQENRKREVVYASPYCVPRPQLALL
jgi:DNA adenine methylase